MDRQAGRIELEGDLADFGLCDLLELVELAQHSGTLTIAGLRRGTSLDGALHMQNGKLLAATAGDLAGVPAVLALCTCTLGHFRWQADEQLPTRNLDRDHAQVVALATELHDAWVNVERWAPDPTGSLRLVPNPRRLPPTIDLPLVTWRILAQVAAGQTLATIVDRSELDELHTYQLLSDLLAKGLIAPRS